MNKFFKRAGLASELQAARAKAKSSVDAQDETWLELLVRNFALVQDDLSKQQGRGSSTAELIFGKKPSEHQGDVPQAARDLDDPEGLL